ncbi:uncharacterized protein VNE69_08193 [Vairimorpha necatrix]|uniref:Uncharacterized protein n=1 Tax=Vairimorpha necatrix TaxID=6039 RepID=A0AAX4JEY8_9MICR
MVIFTLLLLIYNSFNLSHSIDKGLAVTGNASINYSVLMYDNKKYVKKYKVQPFNIKYDSVTVENYNSWYDSQITNETFECVEHFRFKPKKIIYNVIIWEIIFKASNVVFDALMSHKDIIEIIYITNNMNRHKHSHDFRYYFKIFVTKFLINQPTKIRLHPIGHLFELLAYHSYDLIFDLSFYSSFEDKNHIKKIKKLVYDFIDVRIKKSCPWHITQLYNDLMNSNIKIKKPGEIEFIGSRG